MATITGFCPKPTSNLKVRKKNNTGAATDAYLVCANLCIIPCSGFAWIALIGDTGVNYSLYTRIQTGAEPESCRGAPGETLRFVKRVRGSPMALARIITRFPEESRELAENLRSRGFEVQTESPGKTSVQPADVEIRIEECDAEEALQRTSAAKDGYAFVMPGAITGAALPITAIPFIPPMAVQENESVGAEAHRVGPEVENLPAHAFGLEPARADSHEVPAPISDLESQPSVVEDAGAMIVQQEHSETRLQAEKCRAAEFDISGAGESQQPPILAGNPEVRSQDMKAEEEVLSAGEQIHSGSFNELTAPPLSASAGSPEPQFATEVSTSSETASPTRIEVPPPPVEEEPRPLGALPTSDWPIWQPISAEEAARAATTPAPKGQPVAYSDRIVDPAPTPFFQPELIPEFPNRKVRRSGLPRHPLFASEKVFWRTATLAGIGALVLLLAMSAHRLSPLPASLQERSADVKAPQTRPASPPPVELKPVTRQSRTGNKGTRSAKPADAPPATAASKVNLLSSKQPILVSPDSSVNGADIAEDTVVRYGAQSGSAAVAPSQKRPAVKPNSDLD